LPINNRQSSLPISNQQSAIGNSSIPVSAYASDSRRSPGPRRGGGQSCTYRKSSSPTLGPS
jgi:hypothetical protein